jgi:hypothetical protein
MWMIIALKNILPFNVFYEYLFGHVHSSLRGGTTKQSPIYAEIASFLAMTVRASPFSEVNVFVMSFPYFQKEIAPQKKN